MEIDLKYKIGQEVFFMDSNKVTSFDISEIKITIKGFKTMVTGTCVLYSLNGWGGKFKESEIFESKEELIKTL